MALPTLCPGAGLRRAESLTLPEDMGLPSWCWHKADTREAGEESKHENRVEEKEREKGTSKLGRRGESSQGKQYTLGLGSSTRFPVIWSPAELGV